MMGMSDETLDDLVGAGSGFDPIIELLVPTTPIPPSCRKANASIPRGLDMLDGRGGGVLRPPAGREV